MARVDDLLFEINAVRSGFGEPTALMSALRDALLLVPTHGEFQLVTGAYAGERWICAFTSREELAKFAIARGEGDREWSYLTTLGGRLLDGVVSDQDHVGIVVDVAGERPLTFPAQTLGVAVDG